MQIYLDLFSSKQNNMSDCSQSTTKHIYCKTCLKRPLKIDKTKVLMINGSLMKVESKLLNGAFPLAICNTFDLH